MKYIIILVPSWGHEDGGINSFNHEFAIALGQATFSTPYTVICISSKPVDSTLAEQAMESASLKVISLNSSGESYLAEEWAKLKDIVAELEDPELIYCVGHDKFTGPEAVKFHKITGSKGKSLVFHHMNYEAYSNIKEAVDLNNNEKKFIDQRNALKEADIVLSVGPKLFDSAVNKVGQEKPVFQILPGIEIIEPVPLGDVFSAIVFGRYDASNDRLKQMLLAATSFARFVSSAYDLRHDATFTIVGVSNTGEVDNLKQKATAGLSGYFNINGRSYTQNRKDLFDILASSSICLMLSVHEGFGLVGMEAVAAGVPLILSVNTGLYQFLKVFLHGKQFSDYGVYLVNIAGSIDGTTDEGDVHRVLEAFEKVAADLGNYKQGILKLREELLKTHLWINSAESFLSILEEQGIMAEGDFKPDKRAVLQETMSKFNSNGILQPLLDSGLHSSPNNFVYSARTVGIIGREKAFTDLKGFMDERSKFEWWTLVGEGGAGKSRLALELSIEYVLNSGWYAGFLDLKSVEAFNWTAWRPVFDTLIVIDNASANSTYVKTMLTTLKLMKGSLGKKVRVLLIERHLHGTWWLPLANAIGRGEIRVQFNAQPLNLGGLSDHQLIDLISAYKSFLGLKYTNSEILAMLKHSKNHTMPLYAIMGICNIKSHESISSNDVFEDHFNFQEEKIWHALLTQKSERDKHKCLIAFINLVDGITEEELIDLIQEGHTFFPAEVRTDLLAAMNLRNGNRVLPIHPDLVAEYFVHRTWIEPVDALDVPDGFSKMVALAWSRNPKAVQGFLLRYLFDFPNAKIEKMIPSMQERVSDVFFEAWYSLKVAILVERISEQGFVEGAVGDRYAEIVSGIDLAEKGEIFKVRSLKDLLEAASIEKLDVYASEYRVKLSEILEESQDVSIVLEGSYTFYRLAKLTVQRLEVNLFEVYRDELVKIKTYDQTIASDQLLEKLDGDSEFYKTFLSSLEKAKSFDLSHTAGANPGGIKSEALETKALRLLVSDSLAKDNLEEAKEHLLRINQIVIAHPKEDFELILLRTTIQVMEYHIAFDIEDDQLVTNINKMAFQNGNPALIEEWIAFWERKFSHLLNRTPLLAALVLEEMKKIFAVDGLKPRIFNLFWMCNTRLLTYYLENFELSKAAECYVNIKKMDELDPSRQDSVSRCQSALKMWAFFNKYGESGEAETYYDEAKGIKEIGTSQFNMLKMYEEIELTFLDE